MVEGQANQCDIFSSGSHYKGCNSILNSIYNLILGSNAKYYDVEEKAWDSSYPWRRVSKAWAPQVLKVGRYKGQLYNLLYVPILRNILPAKVNDSMIIRNSISLGSKNVYVTKMANSVIFRTALKAVGKNSENMSLRIIFSQLWKI